MWRQNDMGISEDDEAALWSNLAAQGLDGITALELSSGKKLLPPSLSSSPESESESTTSGKRSGRRAVAEQCTWLAS